MGATWKYLARRKRCVRHPRLAADTELRSFVIESLKKYWPPEAIVGVLKRDNPELKLSFTTIYRAIKDKKLEGITARTHLRRRGKLKYAKRSRFNTIQPEHVIADREEAANNRERIGDWEGDTVVGARGKGGLVTLTDRKSRFLKLRKKTNMSAITTSDAIFAALKDMPRHTLTLDNGSEFADFKILERKLNTTIYFADPHAPWQRGTNENQNGIVRFFFPTGFDATILTPEDVQFVEDLINDRPRKCLGWLSPREVFSALCRT